MEERMADLRRYPRAAVRWPVVLEVGDRHFHLQTVNLSPMGTRSVPSTGFSKSAAPPSSASGPPAAAPST
jgi:hypothetical protein